MNFSKFFSNIQEAPWYQEFLNPVINQINTNTILLDIGTGSGKLIQLLAKNKNIDCIGVDTNDTMLLEAKEKLKNSTVKLLKIEANTKLPFNKNSFDYITICSVLFHLSEKQIDFMLADAIHLLKENGKIIILTPTGNHSIVKLSKKYFSKQNWSILIWYKATKNKAKKWTSKNYLEKYAQKNKLNYSSKLVMNGFAQLEIINI